MKIIKYCQCERNKRDRICQNKNICIASKRDQNGISRLWMRETNWKMREMVVYGPCIEAYVKSVVQQVISKLPVYCIECHQADPFKQSGLIHDSVFLVKLLLKWKCS